MGADVSAVKNRNHYLDDTFKHSVMNNHSPIAFHEVHGDNIRLSNNNTIACRAEGYCRGLSFSNRPVKVNERIYVKFLDISSSWSGALRIGFTANNPANYNIGNNRTSLPRYACPDLTNKPGNWAKALAERFAKEDSVLFYYVDESGDVHYGVDNEDIGVFFSGVNTSSRLWALMDVYGNTRTIQLLAPRSLRSEDANAVVDVEHVVCNAPFPVQLMKSSDDCSSASNRVNLKSMQFHRVHGRNVTLNKTRNMATRKHNAQSLSYLFTSRPLAVEEKLIVRVLDTDANSEGNLSFGVTSCDPANIDQEDMPENSEDLVDRSEYWVVWRDGSSCNIEDIIVCNISSDGELQVSKNGEPLCTVLYVDNSLPLWLFFDLYGTTRQIHLVGSTNVLPDLKLENKEMLSRGLTVSLPTSKSFAGVEKGNVEQESEDCVICYEKPVDCVLYRCGHMCLCYKCAQEIFKPGAQCPVCRTAIKDVIKTFR